jgi:fructoselysine 6-kinase
MVRILGLGDNTVDIYVDKRMQYPGGNAVNVAVLAARCGAATGYLGCLGEDARGTLVENSLRAEGVDLARLRLRPGANAWSGVGHRDGDRVFLGSSRGVRGQYGFVAADDAYIAGFDLTHTSIYSDIAEYLPRLREAAPLLSMDFSEHLDRPEVTQMLSLLDIAFASCPRASDAECQAIARRLVAAGPTLAVLTRGKRGSLAFDGDTFHVQGIVEVAAIDTLGAGDAFIAAFLVAHLKRAGIPAALQAGAAFAATACTYAGGFGHGVPWRDESLQTIQTT